MLDVTFGEINKPKLPKLWVPDKLKKVLILPILISDPVAGNGMG